MNAFFAGAALVASAVLLVAAAGLGIVLAAVDARHHRLPNVLVLPLYPIGAAYATARAGVTSSPLPLVGAALGALALFCGFYLLHRGGGMGGGDVKLAGALGLFTGAHGWDAVLLGAALAFVAGGLAALGLLLRRRAARTRRIAFGPALIGGALVAVALGLAAS